MCLPAYGARIAQGWPTALLASLLLLLDRLQVVQVSRSSCSLARSGFAQDGY
jgi:hypothetical protein